MTVITKTISEKKMPGEKLEQPLVVDIESSTEDAQPVEKKAIFVLKRYTISNGKSFCSSIQPTLCLFMTAVTIMCIGIFAGICIYKLHTREQMHIFSTGWYSIPYDSSNKGQYSFEALHQNHAPSGGDSLGPGTSGDSDDQGLLIKEVVSNNANYFMERFEIDLKNENYEKIDVPDFRGGRQGRFIHDFNINKTGIIDIDDQYCFVMPLNRDRVLPPRNMYDLLKKMYNGYYEVNTEVVRETMKVVHPAISDPFSVGTYIARECQNMPIFLLQPVNQMIEKRSTSDGVYAQFAGDRILEFDILNLDTVLSMKK